MSDLVKRLDIKAGVMEMGERIAWGSDTTMMREAARAIEAKDKRIAELEAEEQLFNKTFDAQQVKIERLREALQHITRMNDHNFRVSDIHDVAKAALLGAGDV